ncbi:GNAT family N-acetyltransferase [Xanthomonas oryzae]|uniref:GNAT family N-acetyltransferase n=1 Tax=Xanthomonas oryzae TaxID=347 RepID=UPI000949DFCC|nr:GNAT family N-acetyltransferase [Xanthomonas oryzae]AXM15413.1 GNAT family N-acetyltransferase [Xanthomonas oryzae pv. oryzae]OLH89651.1 alanine acetyltransferase [Xanthomonas oryzae pv. oryzae]OLK08802.1 alanine acetyltransferase [Xanthomonas oryzae pv. oryzae]RBH91186.1 GNAT family N-acetyltransferase [Xanthomonas oryzae pv. oryzae]RBL06325.1 GNAT family N-acetyltransferase [Xanthomonas oryzae pv. oryzae]
MSLPVFAPVRHADGVVLCDLAVVDPAAMADYHTRNRAYLADAMPLRPPVFYTVEGWRRLCIAYRSAVPGERELQLVLLQGEQVIGTTGFTQIQRGAFQACHMGYGLDAAQQGRGLIHWAATQAIAFAFGPLGLHRVMAQHVPENLRSARVLKRLGFQIEGYARRYLQLNGHWRDHVLTSRLREDDTSGEGAVDGQPGLGRSARELEP